MLVPLSISNPAGCLWARHTLTTLYGTRGEVLRGSREEMRSLAESSFRSLAVLTLDDSAGNEGSSGFVRSCGVCARALFERCCLMAATLSAIAAEGSLRLAVSTKLRRSPTREFNSRTDSSVGSSERRDVTWEKASRAPQRGVSNVARCL